MKISSTVITATTSSRADAEADSFLRRAHALLEGAEQALRGGDLEAAVESGYRSALRTAGAVIARTSFSLRARRGSAWSVLGKIGGRHAQWSALFSSEYSGIYSRISAGMTASVSQEFVESLLGAARDFLWEVEGGAAGETEQGHFRMGSQNIAAAA